MPSGLNVSQTASIIPAKIKFTRKNAVYLFKNCRKLLFSKEHIVISDDRISFMRTDKAICTGGMNIISDDNPPTAEPKSTRFLLNSVPETKAVARIRK
jgi:hypothetical protein